MRRWNDNSGSAALEATLAVPLFLFAMVSVYLMLQCVLAEALVYEAAAETAEYMAELSYTEVCSTAVAYLKFPGYVDEEETVERFISGGIAGVSFLGSTMMDEDNCIVLRVSYETKYAGSRTFIIRKRAYTGDEGTSEDAENGQGEDSYVYVTDYQSVYHLTRSCTYLTLQIRTASESYAEENGYAPCGFCGDSCSGSVYITEEGESYHASLACSGLKRTVYRKRKSEVQGLGACSRCAN